MYRKKPKGWLKHADFMILDLLCLQISYFLAYWLRHGLLNPYRHPLYRTMGIFLTIADIAVLVFMQTLKNVIKRGYYKEFSATVKHVILLMLVSIAYLFSLQRGQDYSRLTMVWTSGIYLVLTFTVRLLWKRYLLKHYKLSRSLLILTAPEFAEDAIKSLRDNNYEHYRLDGLIIVGKDMVGQSIDDIPVVASEETLPQYLTQEWIDEIFAAFPDYNDYPIDVLKMITDSGVTLHIELPNFEILDTESKTVGSVGPFKVLTVSIGFATTRQEFMKRCMDIVGGIIGCFFTLILIIIIGPMIYKESPGPIFFAQERVGMNGRKFKMYKFRSMYLDAEERKKELMSQNTMKNDMMFKLDWDPRIIGNRIVDGKKVTGIGAFIRKTSLDEFPQFWNVLKGDMSLVGTRPPTLDEVEKYQLHHRQRLSVKPGITGMWQVSGRSDITDFEEVVELDTEYIRNWSFGLDLRILWQTVSVVLHHDGAK